MKKLTILVAFVSACNADTNKKSHKLQEAKCSSATDAILYGYTGPVKSVAHWTRNAKDSLGNFIVENDSMLFCEYRFDSTGSLTYLNHAYQGQYMADKGYHTIVRNEELSADLYNGRLMRTIDKRILLTDTSTEHEIYWVYYVNGKDSVITNRKIHTSLDKYCRPKAKRTWLYNNTEHTDLYYYTDNGDTCLQYTVKNNDKRLSSSTIILERDSYGNPLKAKQINAEQNDGGEPFISYQTWHYEYYR